MTRRLAMVDFLAAVEQSSIFHPAYEGLCEAGYPPKVVIRKAEKAAAKGYTEYGVAAHRPWLTDKGRAFLLDNGTRERLPDPLDNGSEREHRP